MANDIIHRNVLQGAAALGRSAIGATLVLRSLPRSRRNQII